MKAIHISVCILLIGLLSCIETTAQTVILDESFDSGQFPSTWSQYTLSTDGGWVCGDSLFLSSNYFRIPEHGNFIATNDNSCQCNKRNDFLFAPLLDLSSYTTVFLEFDYYFEGKKIGVRELNSMLKKPQLKFRWTVEKHGLWLIHCKD